MIGNSQAEKSVPPALSPPYDRRVKRSNAASVLVCSVFAEACEHSIVMRDALGWNGLDYVPMFDNHAVFHAEQVALAITQRASGGNPARVRDMLTIALSIFPRS